MVAVAVVVVLVTTAGATSMEDCMACPRGTYHVPFLLPLATSPVSGGWYRFSAVHLVTANGQWIAPPQQALSSVFA